MNRHSRRIGLATLGLYCTLWASTASACLGHLLYADPDEFSRVYGSIAASSGLHVTPAKLFSLEHPVTAVVPLKEEATVEVRYRRPAESASVTLSLAGTDNVELVDNELTLPDLEGTVSVRFRLTDHGGYDALLLTVSGMHDGDIISETSKVYLLGKRETAATEARVSAR